MNRNVLRLFTTVAASVPVAGKSGGINPFLRSALFSSMRGGTSYETLDNPAPGSPFHYAFPVHDLEKAKGKSHILFRNVDVKTVDWLKFLVLLLHAKTEFYGGILGCKEGRSSDKWQDYR